MVILSAIINSPIYAQTPQRNAVQNDLQDHQLTPDVMKQKERAVGIRPFPNEEHHLSNEVEKLDHKLMQEERQTPQPPRTP